MYCILKFVDWQTSYKSQKVLLLNLFFRCERLKSQIESLITRANELNKVREVEGLLIHVKRCGAQWDLQGQNARDDHQRVRKKNTLKITMDQKFYFPWNKFFTVLMS